MIKNRDVVVYSPSSECIPSLDFDDTLAFLLAHMNCCTEFVVSTCGQPSHEKHTKSTFAPFSLVKTLLSIETDGSSGLGLGCA